jgi:hypothetical protein
LTDPFHEHEADSFEMYCVRHGLDLLRAGEHPTLKPESRLSTLAEVAVFMKAAFPSMTLSIGKNGDQYAYRMDNIRIIRFSQTSSTATLNLKKSLTEVC